MARKNALKPMWLTIEATAHIGRRRIGKLLPLRVEPGRKFLLGQIGKFRGYPMQVIGFGYELGIPIVHFRKLL
jgi:hypothetical protein